MKRFVFGVMVLAVAGVAHAAGPAYAPLPEGFSSFGAAVGDGYVYVYGGHTGRPHTYSTETVTGKFRRLKLADPTKGWEELTPGPHLQGLALVNHGGRMIRLGGMQPRNTTGASTENVSVASCEVYDPKTGKWAPLPDMPAGRSSFDAVVVGDKVVVGGGWQMKGATKDSTWFDTTLILDLSKNAPAWESVPQPFKRRALNVAAIGDTIYAVGGMNADNEIELSVDVFDLAAKTWSKGPKLPGPMMNGFTPAVCAAGGQVYASPTDGKVYKLAGDKWDLVGSLSVSRMVHRLVPAGDGLLALGGAGGTGNVRLTEFLRPGDRTDAPRLTTWTLPFAGEARQMTG